MNSLIKYFVRYPITGDLLMLALLFSGWVGLTNMKSTFFPETPTKTLVIQVVYPGASPQEVEEGIVAKIEDNLKGIAGIDQVKSVCSENSGNITIDVLDEDETDEILQDVKNAVDRISSFPVGMEPPVIFKRDGVNFAISFAVSGDQELTVLKDQARIIEKQLRQSNIISQVALSGFPDEEIEVQLNEEQLLKFELTVAEVGAAIRAANLESTGGKIRTDQEELLIRGRFKQYRAKDLESITVKATPDGRIIRLSDIASLQDRWSESDPSRSWFNNKPAVLITVSNLIEEDMLAITDQVKQYIEDYNASGQITRLDIVRDQSVTLNQRIDLLVTNGVIGFFLVLIFLALFLNIRLAFWVALAIPVSFMGMFLVASMLGVTINVISLFGMILVIGILVDDGIVIAENIYQHYERGASRYDATINGTLEVLPAVFSAIMTTVVAFSSFYFIEGRLGDFFAEMATVVAITLVFSLVEGAFILPAHIGHSKALTKDAKKNQVEVKMTKAMSFLRDRFYAPVLRFALNKGWITFSIVIGVFVIVVSLIPGGRVKTTFFPFIEADNINVSVKMAAGTRAFITEDVIDKIEIAAWEISQELSEERTDSNQVVLAIDKSVGPTTYDASLNISLLDGEARGMSVLEITQKIRERVGPIFGAESITFGAATPFGRPVAVSLLGNNLSELEEATTQIEDALKKSPDLKDVVNNNTKGLKEVNVHLKENARYLGLTEQEVLTQLRQGFFGFEAQRLQRGEDEVKVWIRLDEEDRSSLAELENLRIRTVTGLEIPLNEVAELDVKRGIVVINRLYGQREMQVSADIANSSVSASDAMNDVRDNIVPDIVAQFPSVTASYEGQNREQAKSQNSIRAVMPLIFLLMLFIIILTFRSPIQGFAVFALIPFGLIGVIVGHWVFGAQISLFSILGVIALIGILVNDSLVFVAAYNGYLKQGLRLKEAIYEAGLSRFRPIVLTSVTTIAGLAPLIFEKSFQAQFLIPMAISVAFGLLFITMIILVLLPVILVFSNYLHRIWMYIKRGVWMSQEDAEPANREDVSFANFQND
ncbi:MAG: efflux RND transporter permease subunit [Flavobacteriales bacterium]